MPGNKEFDQQPLLGVYSGSTVMEAQTLQALNNFHQVLRFIQRDLRNFLG